MDTRRGLLLSVALLTSLNAHAYYVETRHSDASGAAVPLRFIDVDPATAETSEAEFRVNADTFPAELNREGGIMAIERAFASWSAVSCSSLRFVSGGVSPVASGEHWTRGDDGRPNILVYFTDVSSEIAGNTVGRFRFGSDDEGRIIGASIVLNKRDYLWATDGNRNAFDIEGVVSSILAGSLGISSTMPGNASYPLYSTGDTSKRTLGPDDIAAIQYLYRTNDANCPAPTEPEAICEQSNFDCPPQIVQDGGVGDGGGVVPTRDSGLAGMDSGTSTPASSSGCGCRTQDSSSIWLASLMLASLLRRKRR